MSVCALAVGVPGDACLFPTSAPSAARLCGGHARAGSALAVIVLVLLVPRNCPFDCRDAAIGVVLKMLSGCAAGSGQGGRVVQAPTPSHCLREGGTYAASLRGGDSVCTVLVRCACFQCLK